MMRLQVFDNRRKFLSALVAFFHVFALKGWKKHLFSGTLEKGGKRPSCLFLRGVREPRVPF